MSDLPADLRLILTHVQSTSARVRFLRFAHGLCAFSPLPALSAFDEDAPVPQVVHHPAQYLHAAETQLGLAAGSLRHEPEFNAMVETPDGPIAVHLAAFTTIDPPFEAAEAMGGRFIAITEAHGCAPVELALLRAAYTAVMG